ncbi:MAG TPA: PAS domain-containing protein [Thermodesulfobacteriota bacterium]|nr:PAS domain-containing protein [Thermodesulfobacteriota bacterium]
MAKRIESQSQRQSDEFGWLQRSIKVLEVEHQKMLSLLSGAEENLKKIKVLSESLEIITAAINSGRSPDTIVRDVISAAAAALGCDTAALFFLQDGRWPIKSVHGLPSDTVGTFLNDHQACRAALAVKAKVPICFEDSSHDATERPDPQRSQNVQFFMIVPMVNQDAGVLFCRSHPAAGAFSDFHTSIAAIVSSALSLALENVRVTEAIQKSDLRRHALLSSICEGYVCCSIVFDEFGKASDCIVLEVNPAFERISDQDRSVLVGRSSAGIFSESEPGRPDWIAVCNKALSTGKLVEFEQYVLFSDRWYSVVASVPQEGILTTVYHDITEQKAAERHARYSSWVTDHIQQNAASRELLTMIAESMRNHLSLGHCFFAENNDERDQRAVARRPLRASEELSKITLPSYLELLTLGDMEAGRTVVNYDASRDTRTASAYQENSPSTDFRAYIAVPLLRDSQWAATFWASVPEPRRWSREEVSLVEAVATRTWMTFEHSRQKDALQTNEMRLRVAEESAVMGTWDVDMLTGQATWSKSLFRILGMEPTKNGAATMEMWRKRIHPDDALRMMRSLKSARSRRTLSSVEYRITRADTGEIIWVRSLGRFLYDEAGEAVRFIGALFDVSECKHLKSALTEREKLLQTAARTAELGLFSLDVHSDVFLWKNELMYLIFGRTPEDGPLSKTEFLNGIIHSDDRASFEQQLLMGMIPGQAITLICRIRRRTGEIRRILISGECKRAADGAPSLLDGVVRDITVQQDAEERLRHDLSVFRTTMETIPEGIIVVDSPDLQLRWVSREAIRISGDRPEEMWDVLGCVSGNRVLHPNGAPVDRENLPLVRAATRGEMVIHEEVLLERSGGTRIPLQCTAAPVFSEAGTLTGGILFFRDTSNQKETEQTVRNVRQDLEAAILQGKTIMEHMSEVLLVFDPSGTLQYANVAGRAFLDSEQCADSISLEEIVSQWSFKDREGHSLPYDEWPLVRAFRKEWFSHLNVQARHTDTDMDVVGSWSAFPVYAPSGELYAIAVTMCRSGEDTKAEEQQALFSEGLPEEAKTSDNESVTLLHDLFEASPIALGLWDRELRSLLVNRALRNLTGLSDQDHRGKGIAEVLPRGERSEDPVTLAQHMLIPDESPLTLEVEGTTATDGEGPRHWLECWYPIQAGGRTAGVAAALVDMTAQWREEVSQRKRLEECRHIAEADGTLLEADDPRPLIHDFCTAIMQHLGCEAFTCYLIDEHRSVNLQACSGIPENLIAGIRFLDYTTLEEFGLAASGTAANRSNTDKGGPQEMLFHSLGISACACFPLFSAGQLVGVLSFGAADRTDFLEDERAIMSSAARSIAAAVGRVKLISQFEKASDTAEARAATLNRELTLTKELLERSFSSSDVGLAYLDANFTYVRVNRIYAEALERIPAFFIGKNHFDLYPNEENERIFRQSAETGEPFSASGKHYTRSEHAGQEDAHWDWTVQPVRIAAGHPHGILVSLKDVRSTRRLQAYVAEKDELIKMVLQTLPVGIWILDKDGSIIQCNPANEVLGCGSVSPGADQSGGYKSILTATGKEIVLDQWASARALVLSETVLNENIEIQCPDGTQKQILTSAIPLRDVKQQVLGALVINQDVTRQKQALSVLHDSGNRLQAAKAQLLTNEESNREEIIQHVQNAIMASLEALEAMSLAC